MHAPPPTDMDTLAVENFKEYLRIPSVHPNIDYEPCVAFLKRQAESLGLPLKIYEIVQANPIAVVTWKGEDPALPSILLNNHMDVVPVCEEQWTHEPFAAEEVDGKIYARGSQDMKCVGIQYLEAIRRLRQNGVTLKRTVHVAFVSDEEVGGFKGMAKFISSDYFKNLNVGFVLDEGIATEEDEFILFYGERCAWQFKVHCPGEPGHASLLLEDTAAEKVNYLLCKLFERRGLEKRKLDSDPELTIGDVMSINVTQMSGGVLVNVLPTKLSFTVDCRIPLTVDVVEWEKTLNQWCSEAGDGVRIDYIQKAPQVKPTKMDETNIFWAAFRNAADKLGLKLKPQPNPCASDCRYLRGAGLPAFGFSPLNLTVPRLHGNDEYLDAKTFLRGIQIYCEIISSIANV